MAMITIGFSVLLVLVFVTMCPPADGTVTSESKATKCINKVVKQMKRSSYEKVSVTNDDPVELECSQTLRPDKSPKTIHAWLSPHFKSENIYKVDENTYILQLKSACMIHFPLNGMQMLRNGSQESFSVDMFIPDNLPGGVDMSFYCTFILNDNEALTLTSVTSSAPSSVSQRASVSESLSDSEVGDEASGNSFDDKSYTPAVCVVNEKDVKDIKRAAETLLETALANRIRTLIISQC